MRHSHCLAQQTVLIATLLSITLLLHPAPLAGQKLNPEEFCSPLKNVAGYFSANFGEMRSNHFHSGIDFKTDGTEGKPVVATADGYISRIFCSSGGYGRALYINHPNGTMSVYAHLQRFAPEIEAYFAQYRHRHSKNRVDISCDSTLFRVKQGEEIARSGNTGGSFGPHLHFEIRDLKTGRTLNPIAAKVIRPKDQIAPYLFRLHYVEVDTVRGVPIHSPARTYEIEKVENKSYRLKQKEPIKVGRNGYFILEASDRKDDVSNTFGIYRLRAYLDEERIFDYRMEGFRFDQTRYCNAVSHYPLQQGSRNEVLRLCRIDGNLKEFYSELKNDGIISLAPSARGELRLVAEDDCGNSSEVRVALIGKGEGEAFRAKKDTLSRVVNRRQTFRHSEDNLHVTIPAGALYESVFYHQKRSSKPLRRDTSIVVLSPTYRVLESSIPLHKAIRVEIECFVPKELQPHVTLASRNRKGQLYRLGGKWEEGRVKGSISTLGDLFVAADTIAPRIGPQFKPEEDLSRSKRLTFKVSDNFSGIASLTAFIDGRWHPVDYHAIRGTASLDLEQIAPERRDHTLTLRLKDGCGNTAEWRGLFRR